MLPHNLLIEFQNFHSGPMGTNLVIPLQIEIHPPPLLKSRLTHSFVGEYHLRTKLKVSKLWGKWGVVSIKMTAAGAL